MILTKLSASIRNSTCSYTQAVLELESKMKKEDQMLNEKNLVLH